MRDDDTTPYSDPAAGGASDGTQAPPRKPLFPGEPVVALGAGVLLLLASARTPSIFGKLLKGGAAAALLGRAASGGGRVGNWADKIGRYTGTTSRK